MRKIKIALLLSTLIWSANLFAFCIYNDLDEHIKWQWVDRPAGTVGKSKIPAKSFYCRETNKRDSDHASIIIYFPHGRDVLNGSPGWREIICPNVMIHPTVADIHVVSNELSYRCDITKHNKPATDS